MQFFKPTKAHEQMEEALQNFNETVNLMGMSPPEILFTDNVAADK
jgi:hypothetical protein